jgi:hypothetical protein
MLGCLQKLNKDVLVVCMYYSRVVSGVHYCICCYCVDFVAGRHFVNVQSTQKFKKVLLSGLYYWNNLKRQSSQPTIFRQRFLPCEIILQKICIHLLSWLYTVQCDKKLNFLLFIGPLPSTHN